MGSIRHFRELDVYGMAMEAAMQIFEVTKGFPSEERYSLLSHPDQWAIRAVREEGVDYDT